MLFYKRQKGIVKGKPVKYYPQVVTVGKPANTQEVARWIALESTLSPADVHAVIRALPAVMSRIMSEGRSVNLDGLGSFRYAGVVERRQSASKTSAPNNSKPSACALLRPRTKQSRKRIYPCIGKRHQLHRMARKTV